ncbi:MAG: iduronate-2-sulfatase [Puniceicoccaceae bacterium MED-G30]|nr:MAG: iduronate-2-sulfatase [Puniceicoccaceae bacterium MED-G30]RPG83712.1 MAG: iduronate-2-sulfatase [Coraliomargarita sp. TMED73]|tara:strand:+ start:12894 stop:14411 length:1518 start_codon:yes stop_codon:yes gene_type:complete
MHYTNRIFILILISLFLSLTGTADEKEGRPNILMLCIDDLNDWVGYLGGHPQTITPHMDSLAARGVAFTSGHCPSPGCSPSRNAILFGIEPHNSGLYPFYNINHIDPEVLQPYTALPLLFRQNGYFTCGLSKVFHNPDNKYRQDEIWDEYCMYGEGKKKELIAAKGYHPEPYNKRTVACPASNPLEDFGDYRAARHAVQFLKREHDSPFFLAVGFIKPHTSFIMPEENWDRFDQPIQPPPFRADDLDDIPIAGRSNAQIYVEIPVRIDDAWEEVRRGYLACVNFTDDNVGRVLDALRNSPHAENTIVVLWSDHGYHLGEKRTFSKFSLWEEATRSPFIIWDPRKGEKRGNGQACGDPVGLINIYRTLSELADLQPPEYVDGFSLVPWLEDPEIPVKRPAMTTWGRGNYTLRTRAWRYTRYFDGSEELYDKVRDFNEWNNLAGLGKYFELKASMAKWLPENEAPQVASGRELYNVSDSDQTRKTIESYQRLVKKYNSLGLQPPLNE